MHFFAKSIEIIFHFKRKLVTGVKNEKKQQQQHKLKQITRKSVVLLDVRDHLNQTHPSATTHSVNLARKKNKASNLGRCCQLKPPSFCGGLSACIASGQKKEEKKKTTLPMSVCDVLIQTHERVGSQECVATTTESAHKRGLMNFLCN